jgi:limonene-1,2-epoxide hydrolase
VSNDPEAVVTAFFKAMGEPPYENCRKAFLDYLADDAVWQNSGFPDCNGKEACMAFIDGFAGQTGMQTLGIETLAMSSSGDTVLTERLDSFVNADGETFAQLPLMGVLKVADGKIVHWHDYFDPRPLLGG